MLIGERLRELRVKKNLTQADILKCVGLHRSYISRVEHGHKVPSVETIKKFAIALGVPLYQIFYDGKLSFETSLHKLESVGRKNFKSPKTSDERYISELIRTVERISKPNRCVLMSLAKKMARED